MATYASLGELKRWLGDLADDPELDALLEDCLEAASRKIDRDCDRAFDQQAAATRYLTAEAGDYLRLPRDLVAVTTLATDEDGDRVYETTWAATDYDLCPVDAAVDGAPYTAIRTAPRGTRAFPTWGRGVRIVGTWGWPAVPGPIKGATLVLAHRLFKRADAPLGVVAATTPDGAGIPVRANDPDVAALIAPYRRMSVLGV